MEQQDNENVKCVFFFFVAVCSGFFSQIWIVIITSNNVLVLINVFVLMWLYRQIRDKTNSYYIIFTIK